MDRNSIPSTQNWDARQLIDSVCEDFRIALPKPSHDSIESLLSSAPQWAQPGLLRELVRIEIHYRREHGETPQLQEYLERFPDHTDWVRQQFQFLADTDKSALVTPPSLMQSTITFAPATERSKRIADRYQLLIQLGRGGFGEVWSAHDELLDRHVAVKFLRLERGYSEDLAKMLLREGQRLAQLDHEHIVRVIDAGDSQNQLYLISELMPGGTLEKLLH
ncbi:MAG: protein kinase, partial [Planctomycetaceae bacterium]|nr:protein kinase [Planctomycetaceae bacterium]